jgi:hypothetical protein
VRVARSGSTEPQEGYLMTRTRLLSVAAVAGVALTVAACGGDDKSSSGSSSSGNSGGAEKARVGVIFPDS